GRAGDDGRVVWIQYRNLDGNRRRRDHAGFRGVRGARPADEWIAVRWQAPKWNDRSDRSEIISHRSDRSCARTVRLVTARGWVAWEPLSCPCPRADRDSSCRRNRRRGRAREPAGYRAWPR